MKGSLTATTSMSSCSNALRRHWVSKNIGQLVGKLKAIALEKAYDTANTTEATGNISW
jgi:hypothetical protein